MMNRFTTVAVLSLVLLSGRSLATVTTAGDECCLCNDCDMMMKAEAMVYDLDEDKVMSCTDFAELVYSEVHGTSETCHVIQSFHQASCCLNANLQKGQQQEDPQAEDSSINRRELQRQQDEVTIPFSRRELWTVSTPRTSFGAYQGFGNTNTNAWRPAQTTTNSYAPPNTNGNALGCTVPTSNNAKTLQVYRSTSTGFSSPSYLNCGTASKTGIGMATSDSMYSVTLKCARCNCCSTCTGIDANVCVGNNQPRANSGLGVNSWTWNRRRFLEFLNL